VGEGALLWRFYRIVISNPPTVRDFYSQKALGIPLARPGDAAILRMYDGVSVYWTEIQARNRARATPRLGGYIAVLDIPENAPITIQRTGLGRGHHTLWGPPDEMLRCVVNVLVV
jgi:hypothetical protein